MICALIVLTVFVVALAYSVVGQSPCVDNNPRRFDASAC